MHANIVSHRNAIKTLYSEETLSAIAAAAKAIDISYQGNLDFSEMQRDMLHDVFPGFTYEFGVTSLIETNPDNIPVSIVSVNLDLPDEIVGSYMQNAHLDPMSPLVYANPGRAFNYTHVCPDTDVEDHPFFINHCVKYGIYRAVSVGFLFPAHHNTFITFDYLGDKTNETWRHFDYSRLELASFPFAMAWLFRQKQMDMTELLRRFDILRGLTEHQLQNLRKFINAPHQNFKEQSVALGIRQGTLKDDLYNTRDIVRKRRKLDPGDKTAKGRMTLRAMEAECAFLRMLGDHTLILKELPANTAMEEIENEDTPPREVFSDNDLKSTNAG